MKKTGELLKQKRESANLSLSEVALATKINPKILNAIEIGDESALPAKTFLKGFVRSYALYLKMDVDEVIRQFNEETGGPPPAPVHEAYQKPEAGTPAPSRRSPEESSSGLRTIAVVVIVLLIGLIIGVRELIEKYQREKVVAGEVKVSPLAVVPPTPLAPAVAPAVPGSAPAAITGSAPAEIVKVDAGSAPAEAKPIDTKPVEAKALETKAAETKAVAPEVKAPAEVKPAVPAKPPEAKTAAAPPTPVAKPPETKAPDTKPVAEAKPSADTKSPDVKPTPALKAVKNEIILEALDKVDVEFKVHGETKRLSLAPSQVHTIRTDGPTTLDFSDGGAVNIILNGSERGVPGDLGKPKQVKIP